MTKKVRKHEHQFIPTKVQYVQTEYYEETVVLLNCTGCEDYQTGTLKGHWTLDEIKGRHIRDKKQTDSAFLKSVGIRVRK